MGDGHPVSSCAMRTAMPLALLAVASSAAAVAQPAAKPAPAGTLLPPALTATLHGSWSEPVEPFRVVGNIYYVGAKNIASYLITTARGHILLDTGTREMEPVVAGNIEKLGFQRKDIKILLSGHAHFDHVQGHAAMQRATGAKVMALGDDAVALETGTDRSPIGAEGWEPVHVDRVLKDGDTVELGGTTMKAIWAPGHTPGCTVWTTTVTEKAKPYAVLFYACAGPNAGVQVVGNPKFPRLAEQSMASFQKLAPQKPDIVLLMHPQEQFKDKIEPIKAGATPHPLYNPEGWHKLMQDAQADLQKRIDAEKAKLP
jgi:metallo-beta-lactamase class B